MLRLLNTKIVCVLRFSNLEISSYVAKNEIVYDYSQDSSNRTKLEQTIDKMKMDAPFTIPICIGKEQFTSDETHVHSYPFNNKSPFTKTYMANEMLLRKAVDSCLSARKEWSKVSFKERAKVFLKAADLVSGKYRHELLAATMLGQGKTIFQAEIDAAAELADFLRFNVQFGLAALEYQPISTPDCANKIIYRPTEGFWAALPPFNFTAIAGNLASAPALMGNATIWKPSPSSVYSNYIIYKLLLEAGVPHGVINFVPCDGPKFGSVIMRDKHLAGVNFTGSTKTYQTILKEIAANIENFQTYPRTIGECGGKNYHFIHPSANVTEAALGTLRSAFEYSGQKCSACSRLYVPSSLWPEMKKRLVDLVSQVKIGSPLEKDTFTSAVIDELAFKKITKYIDYANHSPDIECITGGTYDDSIGYYIQPTIFKVKDPLDKIMTDDIFGPFLCVYVYEDKNVDETLSLVDSTSDYGLTGSIFAQDDAFIKYSTEKMIDSVGNLYINVQSTGSVVGNQPFGGARLSGTNDKAGGPQYVTRFTSPIVIKTQKQPITSWKQIHMR